MGFPTLLESELLAVSKALGDTEFGFTGTEIGLLLAVKKMNLYQK